MTDPRAIEAAREAAHIAYHLHNEKCGCRTVEHLTCCIADAVLAATDKRVPQVPAEVAGRLAEPRWSIHLREAAKAGGYWLWGLLVLAIERREWNGPTRLGGRFLRWTWEHEAATPVNRQIRLKGCRLVERSRAGIRIGR